MSPQEQDRWNRNSQNSPNPKGIIEFKIGVNSLFWIWLLFLFLFLCRVVLSFAVIRIEHVSTDMYVTSQVTHCVSIRENFTFCWWIYAKSVDTVDSPNFWIWNLLCLTLEVSHAKRSLPNELKNIQTFPNHCYSIWQNDERKNNFNHNFDCDNT